MKNLFNAAKFLILDLASTIVFFVLFTVTHNVILSVIIGMVLGVGQIGLALAREQKIDTMQWMSLGLVLASGSATLLTHDARFVMFKPSIIYVVVGVVMLKPGWMNRYLPPIAQKTAGDLATIFGFVWAGLMFVSAALNLVLVLNLNVMTWGAVMSAWGIGSKIALFLIQYATMRIVGGRRRHLLTPEEFAAYREGRAFPTATGAAAEGVAA
jgi:intracellular septation protein